MHLLRTGPVAIASAALFLGTAALFSVTVFVPLFLETTTGASPTQAGLLLVPAMLGIAVSTTLSGRSIARTGRYKRFPIAGPSAPSSPRRPARTRRRGPRTHCAPTSSTASRRSSWSPRRSPHWRWSSCSGCPSTPCRPPIASRKEGHGFRIHHHVALHGEQAGVAIPVVENTLPARWGGPPLHHHQFDEAF